MERLPTSEVRSRLAEIDGWKLYRSKALARKFVLHDFMSALKFANAIGKLAEEIQHHPDIILQNYRELVCRTSTHSVGGITAKDLDLARRINKLFYSMYTEGK